MNVMHLISGGDSGGAKTHIHSLLQNLGKEISVTMVCFMEGIFAQEARELGIETIVLSGRHVMKSYRQLKTMIVQGEYDILHCHGARGNMMGALLGRATGCPVISTVHSDYRLDYLGRPLSHLTYGTVNKLALRQMDYWVGVSDATVDMLISRGFNPNQLFAIYNGLDFTPKTPAMTRAEYLISVGIDPSADPIVVGIAARLNPVKDIGTLIRGFAQAYEKNDRLHLLIAGDGEQMEELKNLARELGVGGQITFAGWVGDIDSFYHAIDINTLTSLSETFPYALTEGARAHLPTVASRVGGVPYLIEHGVNGLLFTAGDVDTLAHHLSVLAESEALRNKLGDALHQKAKEDFSIEATVSTQRGIYEAVMLRHKRKKQGRDGVVVCGAYGRGNAGDDAILEAIITELRQLDKDTAITVLSRRPKETKNIYRVDAIYTFAIPSFLHRFKKTRLYINGGGSLMQDVTSHRSLWFYLYTLGAAKRRGNQVMMYGCGIGPISSATNRKRTANTINRCVDGITLRDIHSLEELTVMGVDKPEVVLSADPTVILPAASESVVHQMLEAEDIPVDGQYIGFTLRPWPGIESKLHCFAKAADYAYEHYGLTPVFLPIERRLDIGVCQKVAALMTQPHYIVSDTGNSSQTIGLFAQMKVMVSMRLHGLVFAAGQGVPLVGVVYDPKVSSFLHYIGQDLFTEIEDLSEERLKSHIDQGVARIKDRAFLADGVNRLREIEKHNQEMAAQFLQIESP